VSNINQELRSIIDRLHTIQETDGMDDSQLNKLAMLARDGLIPDDQVVQVRTAMRAMMGGRQPSAQQRQILLNMLGSLADIITSDMGMYQRIRTSVKQHTQNSEGDQGH